MNVLISNVSLIDNGMGIMSLIYSPSALSHAYSDKTVRVQVRKNDMSLRSELRKHSFSNII